MKKYISFVLVAILVTLTACGGKQMDNTTTKNFSSSEVSTEDTNSDKIGIKDGF